MGLGDGQGLAKVLLSKGSSSGNPVSSTFKIHLQFHPHCGYLVWLTSVLAEVTTAIPASFLALVSSDFRYKLGPLKCGTSSLCKCFLYTLIKTHPSCQGAPVQPTLWPPPCFVQAGAPVSLLLCDGSSPALLPPLLEAPFFPLLILH